jgi:hypothetical protein
MLQQAKLLVDSGFLSSSINTPAKAVAVMLKGHELGIPPMYALSNIVIITGQPTCSADLMLALLYRDHGDEAIPVVDTTADRCVLAHKRRAWGQAREFAFTLDDAKRAGLMSSPTWQKYTPAMLRARCISAIARMAFPDSIGGMYTPEELGASVMVDEGTGEVLIEVSDAAPVDGEAQELPSGAVRPDMGRLPPAALSAPGAAAPDTAAPDVRTPRSAR